MATTYNFDSYTTGALNGQNGWTADLSADWDVSTAQFVSSGKSIRRKTGGSWSGASRSLAASATGTLSFRWRTVGTHADPFRGLQFAVQTAGGATVFNVGTLNTNTTGIQGSTTSGSLGSFSTNTWYLWEAEWDYATQKVRARFNGGSWSSWLDPVVSWTTLEKMVVLSLNQEFFIDDIVWTESLSTSVTVTGTTNAATFSMPTYTPKISVSNAISTLSAVFSIPTYSAFVGATIAAVTQSATFSTIASAVTGGSRVTVNTLTGTFSQISATIKINATALVSTLSATFTTVVLGKVGAIWSRLSRNSTGAYTRSSRNSTGVFTRSSRNSSGDWTKSNRNSL